MAQLPITPMITVFKKVTETTDIMGSWMITHTMKYYTTNLVTYTTVFLKKYCLHVSKNTVNLFLEKDILLCGLWTDI